MSRDRNVTRLNSLKQVSSVQFMYLEFIVNVNVKWWRLFSLQDGG